MNTLATSDVLAALSPLLLLAVGIAAIAIVSELVARRITDARRTRGLWQVAVIAMFALAALELTGGAPRLISALLPTPVVNEEVASEPVEEIPATESGPREIELPIETVESIDQPPAERIDHSPTNPTRDRGTEETDVTTKSPSNRVHRDLPSDEFEPKQSVRWPSEAVESSREFKSTASEGHRTESQPPVAEVADSAVSSHPQVETEGQPDSTPELTAGPPTLPKIPTIGKSPNSTATLLIGGLVLTSTCITLLLLLRIVIGRVRLFCFRSRLPGVTDADLLECVRRLRKRFKLRRSIELRESDAVTAPIAFGILRPTIVLPPEFSQQTTRQQQEVVLAHEVTHLAGGDSAWQLAADLVAAVLWWHPGVWFARKRLHAACEWVADESSHVVPHGPDILAECLVALGKSMRPSRRLAWLSAQGCECQSALARRVERLLNMSTRRRAKLRRGSTSGKFLLALVLTASVVFCTAWARPGLETSEGAENMSSAPSSWKQCVAAAVVAVFGTNDVNTADAADAPDETEFVYLLDDEDGERDRPRREGDRDRRDEDREHGDRDRPRREGDRDREHRDREHGERDRPHREVDRDREHREGDRDRPRREGEGDRTDAERVMSELHGRMEALKREAHQIRARLEKTENREGEEAKHLQRKLLELEAAMHVTRTRAEATERMFHQKAVSRRIEELKRQHERLKAAGRHEEAERVAREAREIMRVVERERERERPRREESDRDHRRDRDHDGRHEEAHRRLEHLHRAIENLHEAGLEDQARRLEEQAERIERELGGRRDRERPERRDRPDGERGEHLEREVHELREEMQDLRNELREMRHAFREVIEELEDRHEDEDEDEEDEEDEDELEEDDDE